jgi:hypothetical protein
MTGDLSNQLNAQRLSETVIPILERWRQTTKNSEAKLIFICHSMGGLVATAFGRPISNELLIICRFECAKSWPFRIFSLSGRNDRPNIPAIRHRNTNLCL